MHLGVAVLTTDEMQFGTRSTVPFDTASALVSHFDDGLAQFRSSLAAATPDVLERIWTMRRGDHVILQRQRRRLLRQLVMSHLIHHRAQLGVYYRLLGLPVPGAYGPSADG